MVTLVENVCAAFPVLFKIYLNMKKTIYVS